MQYLNDDHWITRIEEAILSLLLAAMVLITFSQVIARYVFNSGAVWALEVTTTLFAWMILFGASYGIKIGAHLGVDVVVQKLPQRGQRVAAILAALFCILYAVILLDASFLSILSDNINARGGSIDYIIKMYRFGIEMEDLPIPRWIAYIILPIGLMLFVLRSTQALWLIIKGERQTIVSAHEGEELLKEHNSR